MRSHSTFLAATIVALLAAAAVAQDDEFSIDSEGMDAAASESAVGSEVERILSQPDYRRVHVKATPREPVERPQFQLPKWLRDIIDGIGRFLSPLAKLFSGMGWLLTAGFWFVLAVIVLLILYLILRAIAGFQRRWAADGAAAKKAFEEGEIGLNPGDVAADVYVQQAAELAARGEYREAIGLLLLGAMSCAERSAWIRHRRGLTHRDYLRSMRGKELPYAGFKTMVAIYEPIGFGRREAYREHYEASLEGYQRGFSGGF